MTEGGMNISELMTKNNRRNWRRLLVVGLVGLVVLALLITAIILLLGRPDSEVAKPMATRMSKEEWFNGLQPNTNFNGTWLNDNEILHLDADGNLVIYNLDLESSETLLPATNPSLQYALDHKISPDRKYLLLTYNYQKFYRYSYLADYKILNLETRKEIMVEVQNSTRLQLAKWAPRGNALVFVTQNNIYYRPEAEISNDYQITTTGVPGSIYNAVPDWVYEEEVFSENPALWFSPSGDKMAFGYFDDTKTPIMSIPFYGYPGSPQFQYPSPVAIRYPKSGTTNPLVKLYYVDLKKVANGETVLNEIEYPTQLANSERILAAVAFPTENLVSATWMNRIQNKAYFHLYNIEQSVYNTALEYVEERGWVEQFVPPYFSNSGMEFLLILPRKQLDNDYWLHLVMVTNATSDAPMTRTLTSGSFVVTGIVGWDEDNSLIYYLATTEKDSAQQHLYRLSTRELNPKPECLSCDVKTEMDQTYCLYNDAKLSPDKTRYILVCAGPSIPEIYIYNSINATKLITWENNKIIGKIIKEKSQPIIKRLTVPLPDNFEAQVRLLLPPDADQSGSTKYPMLVYVYGGPHSNQVTEKFYLSWGTYLAVNKNIIYASIDGRGSGLKSMRMLFAGYKNLGTVEIHDQINVTRYLQEKFPFIDKTKTAIWGWSYGGYAAGMSLALDHQDTFKCGMSVAPVTDWMLYDSIYTERFMGLPTIEDNLNGYEQGQLINKAVNIKPNSYYLIHGTFDDNVHYQQSLLLARVLEQKDILFRQQTYTDEGHGIGQTQTHLYHSLENFLDDCLTRS